MKVIKAEIGPAITCGNAIEEGRENRGSGWFIGYFISPLNGDACCQDIEVKWGIHRAGEEKLGIGTNRSCKTISLLVRGRFTLIFPNHGDVVLATEGDYIIFGADIPHSWRAEEDSTIISIRWPSVADDQFVKKMKLNS